jgi:hypothetical protein
MGVIAVAVFEESSHFSVNVKKGKRLTNPVHKHLAILKNLLQQMIPF